VGEWPKKLSAAREVAEAGREDADDLDRQAIVKKRFPDDVRIGLKMRAPEIVGEHGDLIGPVDELGVGERAAQGEIDAQRGEKLGHDAGGLHAVR
jgi:hypothetical protein